MSLNISLKKKKKILLLAIIFCCCLTSVGYFYLMYKTTISSNIKFSHSDTWNIKFTDIVTKNQVGSAKNYKMPTLTNYQVVFYTEFEEPGDSITYDVKLKNGGTLNALLNNINFYSDILDQVDCRYEKIRVGTVLTANQETTITIKLTYNPKDNSKPRDDGKIILSFDWIQAT